MKANLSVFVCIYLFIIYHNNSFGTGSTLLKPFASELLENLEKTFYRYYTSSSSRRFNNNKKK